MQPTQIEALLAMQRDFFESGETLSVKFRLQALKKLQNAIKANEKEILAALTADLGKSGYEGYMCEVGLALSELRFMLKHAGKFSKEKRVHTPLAQFAAKSYQKPVPYGNVLIMSPWNYPFLLTVGPLVDAIAAVETDQNDAPLRAVTVERICFAIPKEQ